MKNRLFLNGFICIFIICLAIFEPSFSKPSFKSEVNHYTNSTTNTFEVNSIEKINTAIVDEINHGDNEKWFWIGMLVGSFFALFLGFILAPIVEWFWENISDLFGLIFVDLIPDFAKWLFSLYNRNAANLREDLK